MLIKFLKNNHERVVSKAAGFSPATFGSFIDISQLFYQHCQNTFSTEPPFRNFR